MLTPKALAYSTVDAYEQLLLPRAAHKRRFRHLPLCFVGFYSSLQLSTRYRLLTGDCMNLPRYRSAVLRKDPVISIVDDDQFVRNSLTRLIKSFGYVAAAYPSAGDFGMETHSLNGWRIFGAGLMVAGIALVARF